MSEALLLSVNFSTQEEAERVAGLVIEARLAACANIHAPCTAIYRWHGQVERAEEVPVLFKTRPMLEHRLRERITELHSYDLPVIESWRVAASEEVAAWIAAETTG